VSFDNSIAAIFAAPCVFTNPQDNSTFFAIAADANGAPIIMPLSAGRYATASNSLGLINLTGTALGLGATASYDANTACNANGFTINFTTGSSNLVAGFMFGISGLPGSIDYVTTPKILFSPGGNAYGATGSPSPLENMATHLNKVWAFYQSVAIINFMTRAAFPANTNFQISCWIIE